MLRWFLILVVVFGLSIGLLTGILNPQHLTLDLFFVQFEIRLGVLLVGGFACGALVGALFMLVLGLARRRRHPTQLPPVKPKKALSPGHD